MRGFQPWFWVVFLSLCPAAGLAQTQTQSYLGAEKCRSCHEFAYQVWSTSAHAKAHHVLSSDQLKDTKCNNCHLTMTDELNVAMDGVQCERCHGPGRYYAVPYVMKDKDLARAVGLLEVNAASCLQCHTDGTPRMVPFDFATMWARIDHSEAARLLHEKSRNAGGKVVK